MSTDTKNDFVYNIDHNISDRLHLHHCQDCKNLKAEIDARGTHFSPAEMAQLAQTWKPYGRIVGLDTEGTTVQLKNGETFRITHHQISVPRTPNHEWLRGVVEHADKHWGGGFRTGGGEMTNEGFVPPSKPSKQHQQMRLMYRAYAEVFNVRYNDRDDPYFPLSKKELAKLPKLIAEVRKVHGIAPPSPADSSAKQDGSINQKARKSFWDSPENNIDDWAADVRIYEDQKNYSALDALWNKIPTGDLHALNERVKEQKAGQKRARAELDREIEEANIVRGLFEHKIKGLSNIREVFDGQDAVLDLTRKIRKNLFADGEKSVPTVDIAKAAYDAFMNREQRPINVSEISNSLKPYNEQQRQSQQQEEARRQSRIERVERQARRPSNRPSGAPGQSGLNT